MDEFGDATTVEFACGWIMIPIMDILQPGMRSKKVVLDMCGGTPFSVVPVDIEIADIPQRPGLFNAMKRFVGIKVQSKLEINLNTVYVGRNSVTLDKDSRLARRLPNNIILPNKGLSVVSIFRHLVAQEQLKIHLSAHIDQILPQNGNLRTASPIFSSFPRILSDPVSSRVLFIMWSKSCPKDIIQKENTTNKSVDVNSNNNGNSVVNSVGAIFKDDISITPVTLQIFNDIVLKLWCAVSASSVQIPRIVQYESMKSSYRREMRLRKIVGLPISVIRESGGGVSSMSKKSMDANGSTTTGSKLRTSTKGSLNQELQSETNNEFYSYKPFNVKELLWGNDNYL